MTEHGARWTPDEDRIIQAEGSAKTAAQHLPHRTIEAIKSRRVTLKVARARAPAKWSPDEDSILLRYFPDRARLQRELPHRTSAAIRFRANKKFQLRADQIRWKPLLPLISTLPKGGVSALAKELGVPASRLATIRAYYHLGAAAPANMSRAPQVVIDVRARVEQLGKSARKVAREHGAKLALDSRPKVHNYRALRSIVESLGGEFYVEWDD